jgi:hypothetical protein
MARFRLFAAAGAAALATLTLASSVAFADVTTENRISIQGSGAMSIANMSGTSRTVISGTRSRTDQDIQLQSKLVRMFAHGGPKAEIVLLDADKIDRLDINRKQYSEQTFADLKAHLQKALDKSQEQANNPENARPMDDSRCEWLDPKVDVRRPADKATYAGYDAEHLTIVATQPCKDKETGAICEVALALDEWLAPTLTIGAETEKFHRAYAQKLGLDPSAAGSSGDISERAQAMFDRYKGVWGEILTRTKDVKGYPVKSSFSFAVGGPECKNGQPQQQQQADAAQGASSDNGGVPTSTSALASQMAGKLTSMFRKKKDDQAAQAAATSSVLPDGLVPVITMTSELTSVSTDNVSPSVFEVPADFKKTDARGQ